MSRNYSDYLSLIPKAMIATDKNNTSWIKSICAMPKGYESILSELDHFDVYGHNQLYAYYYQNLPMIRNTFDHLMQKDLSNLDIIAMYLYLSKTNSDYAHEFITKYQNITLTPAESSLVIKDIDRKNERAISDILDILLRSTNEYIRLYYLGFKNKEIKQRVLNYMTINIEDVLERSTSSQWFSIVNSINCDKEVIDNFFCKHIDDLIAHYYGDSLLNLVNYLKPYPKANELARDYIDTHFVEVIGSYYKNTYGIGSLKGQDQLNVEYLYELFTQIKDNEGVRFSDIERIPGGNFCCVLIIGDKVFKFGKERGVDKIMDTPYIIKPLVRGSLETNQDLPFFYEVTEKALPCDEKDVTQEEMYDLYKKLRDEGIVWVDIRENNLGYLLKDNILHWNKPIQYDSESRGMLPCNQNITLKKGDLVIIDNDHRFYEDEVPEQYKAPEWSVISYYQDFENRYQKELKEQKVLIKK